MIIIWISKFLFLKRLVLFFFAKKIVFFTHQFEMFIVFILFYFIVSISSKTVEVDQTQIATFETVLDSWHVQFKFVFCVLEIYKITSISFYFHYSNFLFHAQITLIFSNSAHETKRNYAFNLSQLLLVSRWSVYRSDKQMCQFLGLYWTTFVRN